MKVFAIHLSVLVQGGHVHSSLQVQRCNGRYLTNRAVHHQPWCFQGEMERAVIVQQLLLYTS